jgi:hypothetical protein
MGYPQQGTPPIAQAPGCGYAPAMEPMMVLMVLAAAFAFEVWWLAEA